MMRVRNLKVNCGVFPDSHFVQLTDFPVIDTRAYGGLIEHYKD